MDCILELKCAIGKDIMTQEPCQKLIMMAPRDAKLSHYQPADHGRINIRGFRSTSTARLDLPVRYNTIEVNR